MGGLVDLLFPDDRATHQSAALRSTGILASQDLRYLRDSGWIVAEDAVTEDQIQPASIDLRIGRTAYRVRASFLPGPDCTVREKITAFGMHKIELTGGAVLEKGCVYIVPLKEQINLRRKFSALANPKSSTGRLDIFTRVITDKARGFDRIKESYKGPLYAEISPRTFSVFVREGDRLCQLRIRNGSPPASEAALRRLHEEYVLFEGELADKDIAQGRLPISVDLRGDPQVGIVGYKAKHHTDVVDLGKTNFYEPLDFWEPVKAEENGRLILNPGDFYILASKESVKVPPTHAAEMIAYDTMVGEFRVHYAGFFDPGFGFEGTGGAGARAVLEVRSHEVPFMIEDGQLVGKLVYEPLTAQPDKLYGRDIGSSYQRQGLALAKQFKR